MKAQHVKLLRLVAIFGAILVALKELLRFEAFLPRQEYGYFALYGIGLAVFITLVFLGHSTTKLFKNPDILVPFGLYLAAVELVELIPGGAFYFNFGQLASSAFLNALTVGVIGSLILKIVVAVVFAGWTTRLILQLSERETVDLVAGFQGVGKWFPRTFLVLAVFTVLPVILMIPLFMTAWSSSTIIVLIFFMGAATLLCNLTTYAVLLAVLSGSEPVFSSIANGVRLSRRNLPRAFVPVMLQMLIVGWIVVVSVNYTIEENTQEEEFGKTVAFAAYSVRHKSNMKYGTSFVWVGEYNSKTDWHKDLMSAVESKPLPPIDFKISLLLILLSIVVKIDLVRRIFGFKEEDLTSFDGNAFGVRSVDAILRDRRKIKPATAVLLIGAVVYFLPFEALFAKAGEYFPALSASDSNAKSKADELPDISAVVIPKVYRGEDLFEKSERFRFEKTDAERSITRGRGVGANDAAPVEIDRDELELNDIDDIYAGEIDGAPGVDILVAGSERSFLLDAQGNLKKRIDYNLGSYSDGGMARDYQMTSVRIVDLDGDGKPEIAGRGVNICEILDLDAKPVWKYKNVGKADDIDVNSINVGDVDGDGRAEVVVADYGLIEVFNADGSLKWQSRDSGIDSSELTFVDFEGDGQTRLASNKLVFDKSGKVSKRIEVPYLVNGFLTEKNAKSAILFFDQNKLGLFAADEKLLKKYAAPLSFIPAQKGLKKDDLSRTDYLDANSIIRADAKYVRFKSNEEKYLAVDARSSGNKYFQILYVYNPQGELIYYETIKAASGTLAVMPKENGAESLLLNDDGKLLEYSLK